MASADCSYWIIDDDLSFGRSLRRMLISHGLAAEYFGSAQSFLDSVPPGQSGFAIVDVLMPGRDGYWLLSRMQDLHYNMAVIMVTGHADCQGRELAIKSGAIGYLLKPFSEESLMELVQKQKNDAAA
jgi:FixJ family two-component response regulator